MRKKIEIIITMVVVIALLTSVTLFFTVGGGFAGNIDKSYFTDIRSWTGIERLEFEGVHNQIKGVYLDNLEQIEILIDSDLKGTAISATPSTTERMFGKIWAYDARTVVVWVQSEKEKVLWEEYIQSVTDKLHKYQNRDNEAKTVMP